MQQAIKVLNISLIIMSLSALFYVEESDSSEPYKPERELAPFTTDNALELSKWVGQILAKNAY